jgi:hypothetical protein
MCILIYNGSSSSIILKKFIDKQILIKNSKSTTKWTTFGVSYLQRKHALQSLSCLIFFLKKTVEYKVHVYETTVP